VTIIKRRTSLKHHVAVERRWSSALASRSLRHRIHSADIKSQWTKWPRQHSHGLPRRLPFSRLYRILLLLPPMSCWHNTRTSVTVRIVLLYDRQTAYKALIQ